MTGWNAAIVPVSLYTLMQADLPIKLYWPKEIGTKRDTSAVQFEIQL